MIAFILQTIALSLGAFLIGLLLGRFLKKLFCKSKPVADIREVEDTDSSLSALSARKSKIIDSEKSSVAAKTAGLSAAVAGAATIAKVASDNSDKTVDISADDEISTMDQIVADIDDIKTSGIDNNTTDALSDGETLTEGLEGKLADAKDVVSEKAEGLVDAVKDKAEAVSGLGEEAIDKVKDALPDGETLAEGLEEKLNKEVDSNNNGVKSAAMAAAGGVAATVGASILGKGDKESSDSSKEELDKQARDKKSTRAVGQMTTKQTGSNINNIYVTTTIHRTLRRRHRSHRCRK